MASRVWAQVTLLCCDKLCLHASHGCSGCARGISCLQSPPIHLPLVRVAVACLVSLAGNPIKRRVACCRFGSEGQVQSAMSLLSSSCMCASNQGPAPAGHMPCLMLAAALVCIAEALLPRVDVFWLMLQARRLQQPATACCRPCCHPCACARTSCSLAWPVCVSVRWYMYHTSVHCISQCLVIGQRRGVNAHFDIVQGPTSRAVSKEQCKMHDDPVFG